MDCLAVSRVAVVVFFPSYWAVGIVRFFCDAMWKILENGKAPERLWKKVPQVILEFYCNYSLLSLCSYSMNLYLFIYLVFV